MRDFRYIVFIVGKRKADLFVYTQNVGKLEISSVSLASGGFADADKTAAVIYEFSYCGLQFFIEPFSSARGRRVCIARVDKYVYRLINAVFNVVET